MIRSDTLQKLASLALTGDQFKEIILLVESEREDAARAKSGAERSKAYRLKKLPAGSQNGAPMERNRDENVTPASRQRDEVSPKVPPQEIYNQPPLLTLSSECDAGASTRELAAKADRFYAAYPKKVDPKDAKARFIRIAKSGIDPEVIILATVKYAEAHRLAATDKQFIPAPSVWLNRGSYDSEDLPAPRANVVPLKPVRDDSRSINALLRKMENDGAEFRFDDAMSSGQGHGLREDSLRLISKG